MTPVSRALSTKAAWPLLVTPAWLHANLRDVVVLDCSWHMPAANRDGKAEFAQRAIPSARFLDINGTSDRSSNLPHMLSSAAEFEATVAGLGICAGQHIICYDGAGIFSAPRAWWQFRAFGHEAVSVLDGGLPAWTLDGYETAPGGPPPPARGSAWKALSCPSGATRTLEQMRTIVATECASEQVVDARAFGRFEGTAPEPRTGCVSGHMPGAFSLPFTQLLRPIAEGKEGTRFAEPSTLKAAFESAGVRLDAPLVASCGSGMTACVIALAAAQLRKADTTVYDGSWSEWGSLSDTPIIRKA
mmetsp:Transcript_4338/g.11092  ORF Transcript_4338/g.11092 Transcript_4338/m.11092 type:complete len:302 (+) Transcript_4338:75-980(+)